MTDASEVVDLPQGELPDIPFNDASLEGRELEYIQESVRSGHASSGGAFTQRTAALLAEETGAEEVLLTTSCTAGLELSAMLLDLEPGDTVIVPSFTFTTTALAFARQGAGLVFCDIERRTLGLDPSTSPPSSTRTCGPSSSCTTPASPATSTASGRCSRTGPTSYSSRTTPTGSSAPGRTSPWAASAGSPRRASTRRRTSSAARAAPSC